MFDKVLKEIVPSEDEKKKTSKVINEFLKLLNEKLKKLYDAEAVLGGSFAKDTWLKNDFDIDIFVKFSRSLKEKNISDLLEKVLKELNLKYTRVHASRDYFKVKYNQFCFEIIPIFDIKRPDERENIIDVSPFHVNYVLEKIKENPKLKDEIRLAKYFFKKWGIYGAETSVKGFSGYALELLIIYYKSFENLIKNAASWRPKVFIDVENHYNSIKDALRKLGKDKTRSPLILIDPVDPLRNAASSLSYESFGKLVFFSNMLLKSESFDEKIDIESYVDDNSFCLKIQGEIDIRENVFGKLEDYAVVKVQKFLEYLENQIKNQEFKVLYSEYEVFNKKFLIKIFGYPKVLPKYTVRIGPLLWDTKNVLKFYEKWKKNTFIKGCRLHAFVENKYKNVKELILSCISDDILKKYKIKKIELKV